eukprot:15444031-Alexandrium_andersonii.AAC.1
MAPRRLLRFRRDPEPSRRGRRPGRKLRKRTSRNAWQPTTACDGTVRVSRPLLPPLGASAVVRTCTSARCAANWLRAGACRAPVARRTSTRAAP